MSGTTEAPGLIARMGRVRTGRLAIGAVSLLIAAGYTWQAFNIPFGTIAQPGAGLFPRLVGFGAIIIAVIVIIEAFVVVRDPEDEKEFEIPRGKELRIVLVFFLSTALLAGLLPVLGQYIVGTLYAYGMFMFLGKRAPINWFKSAIYAVVLGVGLPYLFINFLQVNLPDGLILPALLPGLY